MPARRIVATVPALIALVAVTGCEKPTPLVTVGSGGSTVHREATVYCGEGENLQQDNCTRSTEEVAQVEVTLGDPVAVDVDGDLVESGWYIAVGENRTQTLKEHYFRFTPGSGDFGQQGQIELQIRKVGADETGPGAG